MNPVRYAWPAFFLLLFALPLSVVWADPQSGNLIFDGIPGEFVRRE